MHEFPGFPAKAGVSSDQRGVALVIALVLLIAVTLIGLAGIRGTTLQEQMAGNYYDRETAFQAAEAALRLGSDEFRGAQEDFWQQQIDANPDDLDCSQTSCPLNPSGAVADGLWRNIPTGTTLAGFDALDTANQPQYLVQLMGQCTGSAGGGFVNVTDENEGGGGEGAYLQNQGTCYRITARAYDPDRAIGGENVNAERAQVILQATWRI
jgi:type IV pilus assembly protein PilX